MSRLSPSFICGILLWITSLAWSQAAAPATPHAAPHSDYTFRVSASRWTDTGINLNPGDRVHISGGVLDCQGPAYQEKAHVPVASAPAGALLVKLHMEEAGVSASPDAELPVMDPSHLYLGVNCEFHNGTTIAKVHVDHPPAAK